MLEDNQVLIQGMMANLYMDTFRDPILGWNKKLMAVADVVATVGEIQVSTKSQLGQQGRKICGLSKHDNQALAQPHIKHGRGGLLHFSVLTPAAFVPPSSAADMGLPGEPVRL